MGVHPVDSEILHVWRLGITGLSGNMSADLKRYPDAATETAASESVTIAEIGSTGTYAITYTPTVADVYRGKVSETSFGIDFWFEDDVSDAPSTATASNAYCTESDVDAIAQLGDWTTTTQPTETEVLGFMEDRAGIIWSWQAEAVGSKAYGPSGYDRTIDQTQDAGRALFRVCRAANAVGAAAYALDAAGGGDRPARTERMNELLADFEGMKSAVQDAARVAATSAEPTAFAKNHLDEGRVRVGTLPATRDEQGLVFTDESKW